MCSDPPRARPALAHRLDLAREAERAGGRDARGELLGAQGERQLLAADDRVGKVDLVGDRQAGTVGDVLDVAVFAGDLHGARKSQRPGQGVLPLEPGGVKEPDEGQRRAVDDRDLGALDLDQAVVETDAGGRRQRVLDGPDRDVAPLQGRRQVEARCRLQPRRDRAVRMLAPQEDQAVIGRRRVEMRPHRMAGVEADAVDGDRSLECRLLAHASSTNPDPSQYWCQILGLPLSYCSIPLFLKSLAQEVENGAKSRSGRSCTAPSPPGYSIAMRSAGLDSPAGLRMKPPNRQTQVPGRQARSRPTGRPSTSTSSTTGSRSGSS